MNVSNYLADAILNAVFRGTAYTSPSAVYVALYTSNPTRLDVGIEVSGGSYARQSIAFGAPADVSSKRTITSNSEVVFPIATADWGTITHVGIRDASANGNLLYFGELTLSKTILEGDRLKILVSDLACNLN